MNTGLTQQVRNICSALSGRLRACGMPCLQSPLEYRRWRRRDERWQTFPDACCRDWKRAVTNTLQLPITLVKKWVKSEGSWSSTEHAQMCATTTAQSGGNIVCFEAANYLSTNRPQYCLLLCYLHITPDALRAFTIIITNVTNRVFLLFHKKVNYWRNLKCPTCISLAIFGEDMSTIAFFRGPQSGGRTPFVIILKISLETISFFRWTLMNPAPASSTWNTVIKKLLWNTKKLQHQS